MSKEDFAALGTDFAEHVQEILQSDDFINCIKHSIDKKYPGYLSRMFNNAKPFSDENSKKLYDALQTAGTENELHICLSDMLQAISTALLNDQFNDLNDKAKEWIGRDNYNSLLELCNQDKSQLATCFLQAISALIALEVAIQRPQEADNQEYSNQILVPLQRMVTSITVDSLTQPEKLKLNPISEESKAVCFKWKDMLDKAIDSLDKFKKDGRLDGEDQKQIDRFLRLFKIKYDQIDYLTTSTDVPFYETDFNTVMNIDNLVEATETITSLAEKYKVKQTWTDAFWDCVSDIFKRDFRTQASKQNAMTKQFVKTLKQIKLTASNTTSENNNEKVNPVNRSNNTPWRT